MLHLHRTMNFVMGGGTGILILVIVIMAFQSPLVVVMKSGDKHYLQSERRADSITEKDVESFVREFLGHLYSWEKLAPDVILNQVSPFATSGLQERIKQELIQRTEKDFKGKSLSEDIANIRVTVTDKNVIASFDKVLRINGMPLVIPSEVAFNIVRGSSTSWNPMGLYVNGLMEHEGSKN